VKRPRACISCFSFASHLLCLYPCARGVTRNQLCWASVVFKVWSATGRISSPDGKHVLTVDSLHDSRDPDGFILYSIKVGQKDFGARLSGWRAEVRSPDSHAFAVNQTEGRGGIGQRTYIFYLEGNRLRKVDVSAYQVLPRTYSAVRAL